MGKDICGGIQFEITPKGQEYKKFWQLDLYSFLTKSVLVPIIVAVITAAITTWIGWKWNNYDIKVNLINATPSNAPVIEETSTISGSQY